MGGTIPTKVDKHLQKTYNFFKSLQQPSQTIYYTIKNQYPKYVLIKQDFKKTKSQSVVTRRRRRRRHSKELRDQNTHIPGRVKVLQYLVCRLESFSAEEEE
jgi:hypothetical protein